MATVTFFGEIHYYFCVQHIFENNSVSTLENAAGFVRFNLWLASLTLHITSSPSGSVCLQSFCVEKFGP